MSLTIEWSNIAAATQDEQARERAIARQGMLTKPPGALGRLEQIAIDLAAMQANDRPSIEKIRINVFAGDHGVAAEGVSAFPQAVTGEMVKNFARGGAAISVLARALQAELEVINLGTVNEIGSIASVVDARIAPSTQNMVNEPAMTEHQLARAMHAGRHAVERAKLNGAQLFIGGEMGIANTTAATALSCVLLDIAPSQLAGPGTGLNPEGVKHKVQVIEKALNLHLRHITTPAEALRRLGGFEIAALCGAYIACAQIGIPMLIDGFISTSAALTAARLCPNAQSWMFFSHASAEPGHAKMLSALNAKPLLDIGMRLGEGSGAAVCVPLLQLACKLHNEMATFAEASVSEKAN